jgi:hypothetical protein
LGVHIGSVITAPFYTDAQVNNLASQAPGQAVPDGEGEDRGRGGGESRPWSRATSPVLGASAVIFSPGSDSRTRNGQCATGTETYPADPREVSANAQEGAGNEVYNVDPDGRNIFRRS